jgi:antitoxin YefM
MKTTSFTEFRRHLAETIDQVNDDREPVLITRDRGKPTAVLISLDDYASLEETRYLLSSPRNAERLLAAIKEADAGLAVPHDLIE